MTTVLVHSPLHNYLQYLNFYGRISTEDAILVLECKKVLANLN
jgi:hypothetical protein